MYSLVKIFFENNGQDYLQWTVKDDVVVESLPDTGGRWLGVKVDENYIYIGNKITVTDRNNDVVLVPHSIEDIIQIKRGGAEAPIGNGSGLW